MSDTPVSDGSPDLVRLVADLLAQLAGTAVTECEFRTGAHRVFVRRSPSFMPASVPASNLEEEVIPAHWRAVVTPVAGIFYAAENPQTPPLVSIDDTVSVGQAIGLVEAMKTFNRVESDVSGIVRAILVVNGVEVQAGQPLVYVEPFGDQA